jgi:hypothetical protein
LFAAPHDLSQRTTSFIASQRQGIHRIPLRHLIALIIDAHRSAAAVSHSLLNAERYIDRKTICFKCIRERRGQADVHLLVCSARTTDFTCDRHTIGCTSSSRCRKSRQTRSKRLQAVCRTSCRSGLAFTPMMRRWWSQTGSNRRPHACKARALPTELWPRAERALRACICA